MPSAPQWLQDKFPGDATEAMNVLEEHYTFSRDGMIQPKDVNRKLTEREDEAIDYLFREWDYGYIHAEAGMSPKDSSEKKEEV